MQMHVKLFPCDGCIRDAYRIFFNPVILWLTTRRNVYQPVQFYSDHASMLFMSINLRSIDPVANFGIFDQKEQPGYLCRPQLSSFSPSSDNEADNYALFVILLT